MHSHRLLARICSFMHIVLHYNIRYIPRCFFLEKAYTIPKLSFAVFPFACIQSWYFYIARPLCLALFSSSLAEYSVYHSMYIASLFFFKETLKVMEMNSCKMGKKSLAYMYGVRSHSSAWKKYTNNTLLLRFYVSELKTHVIYIHNILFHSIYAYVCYEIYFYFHKILHA